MIKKTEFLFEAHGFDHLLGARPLHSYLLKRKMVPFLSSISFIQPKESNHFPLFVLNLVPNLAINY